MNFHSTQTRDNDEFEFTASYGTAVFLIRGEKSTTELFGEHRSAKAAPGLELGEYHVRHPKAA